ncbi:winged helix-turn-helix domain-containing protein [Caldibacillus debilis]|jgi:DNA-binding transcriptional ArsR family regulator|uniref:winged helix-turn-helix domain-containing protein n=1 Tax=Caldibacillus debilis TaxID=301148 RepID=UPI000373F433|nr:winged helix-turn-helix domain-containing protein [Caldibacillus debilis]
MNNKELEIAKSLFNLQRIRILQAVKEKEKTVKEIAEILNEKPSRLYYHVHQLEDLGLLEVVREKQVGNLIQKYYKSVDKDTFPDEFTFTGKEAYDNADYIISQLYAFIDEALSKIYTDLNKKDYRKVSSEASIINVQLTKDEWREVNKKIREVISTRNSEEKGVKEWNVRYIIMSYLDDL